MRSAVTTAAVSQKHSLEVRAAARVAEQLSDSGGKLIECSYPILVLLLLEDCVLREVEHALPNVICADCFDFLPHDQA